MRSLLLPAMLTFLFGCAGSHSALDFPRTSEECLARKYIEISVDLRSVPLDRKGTRLDLGKVGICLEGEKVVGIAANEIAEWSNGTAGSTSRLNYHVKKVGGTMKLPDLRLILEIDQLSFLGPGDSAAITSLDEMDVYFAAYSGSSKILGTTQAALFGLLADLIDSQRIKPLQIKSNILSNNANVNGLVIPLE